MQEYVGKHTHVLPIDVPFDMEACNLITSKVTDFNELDLVYDSNVPIIRIVGELDPFYTDKVIMRSQTLVLKERPLSLF